MAETDVSAVTEKLVANIEKVIIGKRQPILLTLVAVLCEGHVLLEDVPGVAKTMLARALRPASAAPSSGSNALRTCCRPT